MTLAINVVQVLLLLLLAPLVRGVIARLKARIQNRHGASVWRPYADLLKLFRKEDLVPDSASFVFRLAPIVVFAATLVAAAFVPLLHGSALLEAIGDFILLVYLLALGRFFLMLGAMDGGSSFGGILSCWRSCPWPSRRTPVASLEWCSGRWGKTSFSSPPFTPWHLWLWPWSPSQKRDGCRWTIPPRTWN
jgi:formate hydrogenlyase subunit 4